MTCVADGVTGARNRQRVMAVYVQFKKVGTAMNLTKGSVRFVVPQVVILLVLLLSAGCASGRSESMLSKAEIESTLSVLLPQDSSDYNFKRIEPSSDLALAYTYIKFTCSEASYISIVQQMGLQFVTSSNSSTYPASAGDWIIALGDWREAPNPPVVTWWDAELASPSNTASQYLSDGHIMMKYENGSVYVVKVTGVRK